MRLPDLSLMKRDPATDMTHEPALARWCTLSGEHELSSGLAPTSSKAGDGPAPAAARGATASGGGWGRHAPNSRDAGESGCAKFHLKSRYAVRSEAAAVEQAIALDVTGEPVGIIAPRLVL